MSNEIPAPGAPGNLPQGVQALPPVPHGQQRFTVQIGFASGKGLAAVLDAPNYAVAMAMATVAASQAPDKSGVLVIHLEKKTSNILTPFGN